MTAREIVLRVTAELDASQIPYMLTGAIASSAYGLSRGTKDLDVVVELENDAVAALVDRMGPEPVGSAVRTVLRSSDDHVPTG